MTSWQIGLSGQDATVNSQSQCRSTMHRTRTAERPLLIGITVVLRKAASAEPIRRVFAIRRAVLSIGHHLKLCMSPEAMQYAHSMHVYAPRWMGPKGAKLLQSRYRNAKQVGWYAVDVSGSSMAENLFFRLFFVCVLTRMIRAEEQWDKEDASK